jgi:predicted O-methyltransferase YrrM
VLEASAAAGLPPHNVSAPQGKLLMLMALMQRAKHILEIGTLDIRVGHALDTLPKLLDEKPRYFDMVFIDADKRSFPDYLEWALRLSRRGTVIVADNVVRDGAVTDASSKDPNVVGVRRFVDLLGAETRVSATAIQTVGTKGWDGFAIGIVVANP